jgi:hypothetical protein
LGQKPDLGEYVTNKEKMRKHLTLVEKWDNKINTLEARAEEEIGRQSTREIFLYRMSQYFSPGRVYKQAINNRNHNIQMAIMYGIAASHDPESLHG